MSTGDVVVGNGAIALYWGRNGRVWCCRSLLGTMLKRMTLYISTGDGVVTWNMVPVHIGNFRIKKRRLQSAEIIIQSNQLF